MKIEGYHYHNDAKTQKNNIGAEYVRNTLIDGLLSGKVKLPTADRKDMEMVSMKDLGIAFPVLWNPQKVEVEEIPDPKVDPGTAAAMPGRGMGEGMLGGGRGAAGTGMPGETKMIPVPKFKFNVQFCWQPKLPSERQAAKEQAEKDKAAAAGQAAGTP